MFPIVSIITPSFNRGDIIQETANSIFNQSYPYWEWVVVDDGSTDNSLEILRQYAADDSRVKVYQRDRSPKGAAACRNIGVERCAGEYVMFLDTDDILATFCLQQRVKIAQENVHCDFVIFPMLVFYQKPDDLKILWNIDNETDDVTRILTGDPICQGTGTLWRKQSFINIGLWDENLLLWQDIELHLRSMLGGMRFVKRMDLEPDVFIRISDVSLSRTGYHSLPKWKSRLKVLTDTTVTVLEKNLLPKYRDGLRHMFTDLFMNAAGSNFFQEAKSLLKQEENWNILKPSERSILKRYLVMRRARLYKLPFIEKSFRKNLRSLHTPLTATINRVTYHKKIQL